VGGFAVASAQELRLTGTVTEAGNSGVPRSIRMSATGSPQEAERLGRELAARMLAEGAAGLMGKQP
jgi:hydroxymethylbilane synthase